MGLKFLDDRLRWPTKTLTLSFPMPGNVSLNPSENYMRKKTIWIVLSITSILFAGLAILACGAGYYIYSLFQVEPVTVASDASEADRIVAVEHWLDEQFKKCRFNGGVLVMRDGETLLCKTCGFTNHNATQRLDEHSAFRLASVSKQFTAAGVLRLAEMGLLDLDDPVSKHLDGFTIENVTIRHLLNQTSGIPDEYMTLAEQHRESLGDVLTVSKVVELINQHSSVNRAPGEAMEYSNTNYVLLAGVVEAVSEISFEEFMSKELFQPLGMNDTRIWNLLSAERSPNQASDFDQVYDERAPVEPSWLDGIAGDGAVFCSLHDFKIWDRFWNGSPLVSDALLEQAFERPKLNDGNKSDYGFGWVVERKRHWHNGAWLGANTYIARYPASRCCIVVLDNSSNLRLENIASEIRRALKPILSGE